MTVDESTPVEVWREYEARKRAIDAALSHRISELYRRRDLEVQAAADALGCGVADRDLTPSQRAARDYAIARWRETQGCAG